MRITTHGLVGRFYGALPLKTKEQLGSSLCFHSPAPPARRAFTNDGSDTSWRVSSFPEEISSKGEFFHRSVLPRNILILRHGQSLGNADESLYATTPDWKMPLSDRGRRQARAVGRRIQQMIGTSSKVLFYVSPYLRTKQTLDEIQTQITNPTLFIREEPRLREQDFGNFQDVELMQAAKEERPKFGRFFFRFPEGESGADVFDRVSAFSGTFLQDMEQIAYRIGDQQAANTTAILITHGITGRLFVMRWLHWSVDDFEKLHNPPNCGLLHMKRTPDGTAYDLADESRDLIQAPRVDKDSGYVGSGLKLGELLKAQHTLTEKDRDAFNSLPDSAWGM